MEVTEEGIVTEDSLVQPEKASTPMEVTEEGMTTFPLASGVIFQVEKTSLGNRPNTTIQSNHDSIHRQN